MNKRNAFASHIAWLALLSTFCLFADSPALASQPVKFKQLNHFVIVPVFINGTGPLDFIFDTGASSTVIDQELVKRLGLTALEATNVSTVSGSKVVPRYRLDSLAVGPRSVKNLTALSTEMRQIHSIDSRIRGILGQNFLSGFNYILNYRDRRIEFEESDESVKRLVGVRLPVERDRGRVLIAAKTSSTQKTTPRMVIDSGASSVVIFSDSPQDSGFDLEMGNDRFIHVDTVAGSRMLRAGLVRRLQIGEEVFEKLPARLVQGSTVAEGRLETGLLPAKLFRAIYFNNSQNYVILNPRFVE